MKRIFLLFFVIFFIFQTHLPAQVSWLNFSYTNEVKAIEYDGEFWWIGTEGGLVKFQETTGVIRIYNRGNSNIPSNHIQKLTLDENGKLYLATDYGLSVFDGTHFTNYDTTNSEILSNHIRLLDYEIGQGVWVVTDSALTFFDGTNWTHYRTDDEGNSLSETAAIYAYPYAGILFAVNNQVKFLNHANQFSNYQYSGTGYISAVGFDFDNNPLVATADNGYWASRTTGWEHFTASNTPMPSNNIFEMTVTGNGDIYFNHGQNGFSVLHRDNTWNLIPNQDGNPLNYLTTLYAGDKVGLGVAWPYQGFVVGEHPEEWTYNFSDIHNLNRSPIHSNEVQNIVISGGKKYIANRGIDILDENNQKIKQYDYTNGDYYSLYNPTTFLAVDAFGNIWCADNLNVSLTRISGEDITLLNDDSLGITNPLITGIQWETNKTPDGKVYGTLWVSVDGADYDGIIYLDSLWHRFANEHPAYPWGFNQFVRDAAGIMWFADHSIYAYDGSNFVNYWSQAPIKEATSVVRWGLDLWFGGKPDDIYGWRGGLVRYRNDTWTQYTPDNSPLPDEYVTALAVDTLGNLWVGTNRGGLVKIDTLFQWTIFNRENSPLDNNSIVKIAVDPATNDVWVLNRNSGVFVYNESGFTGLEESRKPPLSGNFILHPNFPNPFNPVTQISYQLPTTTEVEITVYNLLGEKIRTLVKGRQSAGLHRITFDAANLPSGCYLYRMKTPQFQETRKMLLLK